MLVHFMCKLSRMNYWQADLVLSSTCYNFFARQLVTFFIGNNHNINNRPFIKYTKNYKNKLSYEISLYMIANGKCSSSAFASLI